MPKIFDAPKLQASGIAVRRATGEDFGAQTGAGMETGGQALVAFGEQLKKRADRQDAVEIEKQLIDADVEFTERQKQLAEQAEPGADGFTSRVRDEVSSFGDGFKSNFSHASPENQQRLEIGLARMRAGAVKRAMVFESASKAKKIVSDTKTAVQTLGNTILQDPAALEDNLAKARAVIDASGMQGDARANLEKSIESDFVLNHFKGRIAKARTPEEMQAATEDLENFKDRMDAGDFAQIFTSAEQAKKQLEAKVESEFKSDMEDAFLEMGFGVARPDVTEADIRANVVDVREQERLIRDMKIARSSGEMYRKARYMSPTEIASTKSELVRRIEDDASGDIRQETAELAAFNRAVSASQNEMKQDSARYMEKTYPHVADSKATYEQAAQNALVNPEDETAQQAAAFALDEYVSSVTTAHQRHGLSDNVKLLRNEEVVQFKSMLASIDRGEPDAAENTTNLFAAQSAKWGKHWPTVFRQLESEKAVTGPYRALARMAGDPLKTSTSIAYSTALAKTEKELMAAIPASQETGFKGKLQKAVVGSMADLTRTLGLQNAQDVAADYVVGVKHLTMFYMSQNMDMDSAAEAAFNELVGADYNFTDSYRVPSEHNLDEITAGASRAKKLIGTFNISPVLGLSAEDTARSLAANGTWVTSPNEDGLLLLDEQKRPVLTPTEDGRGQAPLVLTWGHLKSISHIQQLDVQGDIARKRLQRSQRESRRAFDPPVETPIPFVPTEESPLGVPSD